MPAKFNKIKTLSILAVVFGILLYPRISWAAEQEMFDIYSLEVEGHIHGFLTGEFNGDNLADVVVIYSPHDDRYVRYLSLYLQKVPTAFRPRADYIMTLPNSIVQIDVNDINNDGLDEILFIDANGIGTIGFSDSTGLADPKRIIDAKTVFAVPIVRGIIIEPFVYDLTPQPGNEIIFPTLDGYSIFGSEDGRNWKVSDVMKVPLSGHLPDEKMNSFSSRENQELHLILPRIYLLDGNLDGNPDIYYLWKNRVCCFFRNKSGGYSSEPDFMRYFVSDHQTGYQQSYLADCNGDKHPDLVILSSSGGITSTESKLRLYIADSQGRINSEHSDEITLSDSHSNLILNDYNFDSIPEIIVPAIEMGTFAATKIFLTKKTDMHLLIYSLKSGRLAGEPEKRLKYEFKCDFSDINPIGDVSINWEGNYNSDRFLDAVFCDGKGRMLFYWGRNSEYLSDSPDLEIPLDHPSKIHPMNLNPDDESDIIVEHNLNGRYDRLSILINKFNRL